jgi:FkbM family methyltransferase
MTLALRVQTEIRTLARRVGLLRVLSRARALFPRATDTEYEARLRRAMADAIRSGDVVWDIGANLGVYTELFSRWVGATGTVCAFEPAPACFEALKQRTTSLTNTKLFSFALGDQDGTLPFNVAADPLAATHSLAFATNESSTVRVARADTLITTDDVPTPNVLKIDVEGFEEEVVDGARALLARQDVRAVFIEVHFGILESRGKRHAPSNIVGALESHGFATRWVDASHLMATRSIS